MNLWTILPVKTLAQTKSRLAGVLSPDERAALTLHLLERTLGLLAMVPGLAETAVITQDPIVAKIAIRFGCRCLAEPLGSGLNGAVSVGVALAAQNSASHCLVLPSDLPFLTEEALVALVGVAAAAVSQPTLFLCSDRQRQGTNALVMPTGVGFCFAYGRNSFYLHQQEAKRWGLAIQTVELAGFQFDLDTAQDYALYAKRCSLLPS